MCIIWDNKKWLCENAVHGNYSQHQSSGSAVFCFETFDSSPAQGRRFQTPTHQPAEKRIVPLYVLPSRPHLAHA